MDSAIDAPEPKAGRVILCVGTTKGLWLFSSDDRRRWDRYGPFHVGASVPTVLLHRTQDRLRLVSPAGNAFWGLTIQYSDDLGASWAEAEQNPHFGREHDASLESIWTLEAHPDGTLYAGVEPAAIFTSRDGGESWQLHEELWNHPHRPRWEPGGGGLCLHTVRFDPRDPDRIYVAISTGGIYRSEDGGRTWRPRNEGIAAGFLTDEYPEYGQCVHKFDLSPVKPERLYLQNHGGVYRSDDGGDAWEACEAGLPGNFGFPVLAHPRDPETAYVIPLDDRDAMPRWTFDGRLAVYRTRDGGASWRPLTDGLPQEHAYMTILREALATDGAEPLGVYFGTKSGHVYASDDGGDHWQPLAELLPPVLAVKAYQL